MTSPAPILSLRDVRAYLLAGQAIFTLVSKKTGNRKTFRVRRADPFRAHAASTGDLRERHDPRWFVDLLTGPENTSDYTYIGWVRADEKVLFWHPNFRLPLNASANDAFGWLLLNVNAAACGDETQESAAFAEKCEFLHSGYCSRCGRLLTDPTSIRTGLGPVCAEKGAF